MMIRNSCCENLVLVDRVENRVNMIFDYITWFERAMDDIPGIRECRPEVYKSLVSKLRSGTMESQLFEIYTYTLKHTPERSVQDLDEELKLELEKMKASDFTKVKNIRVEVANLFEALGEGFQEVNGRGFGYRGLLTMDGKRLIQYHLFNSFLDETPEVHLTILKRLLTKYLAVYPLRKELTSRIKDFYSEAKDLFISMDENHELVMDVCLLPLYLTKDDKHFMNIAAKIIPSETGLTLNVNGEEIMKTETPLFSSVTATPYEIDPLLPPTKKYVAGDIWKKEFRAMLPIIILLILDSTKEIREWSSQIKDSATCDLVNYIYIAVSEGIPINKSKIRAIIKSVLKTDVYNRLLVEILYIVCNPDESLQPTYLEGSGERILLPRTRIDFNRDIIRALTLVTQ